MPAPTEHKHRRRFIGPMPESVLTSEIPVNRQTQKKRRWFSSSRTSTTSQEDEEQCLRNVIKAHAYEFFKGHGGKDEDWEVQETGVREEMLKRWKQSEWGKLRNAKESGNKNRWVGTSFDIGNFLGVNVLDKDILTTSPMSSPPASPTKSTHAMSSRTGKRSAASETFVTAPTELSPYSPMRRNDLGTQSDLQGPSSYFPLLTPIEERPAATPEEFLQGPSQVMDRLQAPDVTSFTHSNDTADKSITPSQRKGKKKQVRYEDNVKEDEPAPPSDVLARSGLEVTETSAGAAEIARMDTTVEEGGIVMRGQLSCKFVMVNFTVTLRQIACWFVYLTRMLIASGRRSMRIKIGSLNT